MEPHEENTGIVDWFLGPNPYMYPPYGAEMIHDGEDEVNHYHHDQTGEYYREYEEDHRSSSAVDNDEIIARTLQDDFLQLQIAEENNNNDYSNQHQEEEGYTNSYSNINNEYSWNDQPALDYSPEWVEYANDQDPYTYPPYGAEMTHDEEDEVNNYHHDQTGEYYREYEEDHRSSSAVDNDEIIARTLQDDFSDQQHQHQEDEEWVGNENDQDDDSANIYSCSSPSDTDEYVYSWESGQCDADGEFGRRLNQMVPIPYVPKINGEIPPEEEAVSDHERLRNRLELFDFAEVRVQGDGNCQFRALADQLYKTEDRHKHVRRKIVKQLKSSPNAYEGYVPMDFSEYLEKMSWSGEWGDHVTLRAAADVYRVKIVVLTSFKDTCYIEILPTSQESNGVIFLSFWAEVHYNSIYLNRDTSATEIQRRRKWWRFGN